MKVLFLETVLTFDCIPREYPQMADALELVLSNEQNKTILTPEIEFMTAEKLSITLKSQPAEFKSQQKYDILLKVAEKIIYKGRLIVLDTNTDTQKYNYGSQSSSRFRFR